MNIYISLSSKNCTVNLLMLLGSLALDKFTFEKSIIFKHISSARKPFITEG